MISLFTHIIEALPEASVIFPDQVDEILELWPFFSTWPRVPAVQTSTVVDDLKTVRLASLAPGRTNFKRQLRRLKSCPIW